MPGNTTVKRVKTVWRPRSYCLSCGICCTATEMILTTSDIERIERLGFKREDFAELVDGFFRLKNVEGRCVFFKDNRCTIYDYRPIGCSLYPIVIEAETGDVTLDRECPLSAATTPEELSKARRLARLILGELARVGNNCG